MIPLRVLCCALPLACLAGCAGDPATVQPLEPEKRSACCRHLGEATYVKLVPGETREFRITSDYQSFGFPEGRSHFAGVALPPSDLPRSLTVRTLPMSPLRASFAHVFIPRIAVVGPDGRVTRYTELEFQQSTRWIVDKVLPRNTGWEGRLTLAAGESRVVVYTATLLAQSLRINEADQVGGPWVVPSGATGVLEITLNR